MSSSGPFHLLAIVLAFCALQPVLAAEETKGARLLARAAERIGGGSETGIRSLQVEVLLSLTLGERPVALRQTVSYRPPDRIRQVLETPVGEQVMVINGDRGYLRAGEQQRHLEGDQVRGAREDLARELLLIVGDIENATVRAGAGGELQVGEASCSRVEVVYGGILTELCIDADGFVRRQSYEGNHPFDGQLGRMEILFSDYREVDGRSIPYQQELLFDGKPLGGVTLRGIAVNPDLAAELFEVPN